MDKLVKEAFGEALKDSEKEKKEKIKKIILETLRKKVELEENVKEIQQRIKILGKDLEDFKQGRLDLIEERQKVDETARKTSVVRIEKIIEHHYYLRPWYEPFNIHWYPPCDNTVTVALNGSDSITTNSDAYVGTDFHNFFSGTYEVGDKIFNL